MTNSFKIFLLVSEEMSFSKAAKKAFITQQCLSDHIKRLERTYGVTLFYRKPRVALTPAGEAMLQTIHQIQVLENGMANKLKGLDGGTHGKLSFGINTTRARILIPKLFSKYNQLFPNVELSVYSDDTYNMEEMLLKGKIDLFMGVNTSSNPLFQRIQLVQDKVHLIISDKVLSEYFADSYPACKDHFRKGVDLKLFKEVPMVRNLQYSTLTDLIDQHINQFDIQLNTIMSTSDYDTQFELCISGLTAAFCPSILLQHVIDINKLRRSENHINIFPIKGFEQTLRIDLVYLKNALIPLYFKKFIELLHQEVRNLSCEFEEYLK
jgi:DNA-binding transcriptional LysR family regulator